MSLGLLDWRVEGPAWPHHEHSRFVRRGRIRWHVQILGRGPALLLLHGTGASTHSLRELMPRLAERYTVVAPDLPGHAFSSATPPFEPSLTAIAAALGELLDELGLAPEVAVGHSAGAALLARLALDGAIRPRLVVGLAPALVPFRGVATALFSPAARLLARSSLAVQAMALRARNRGTVERLLQSTGSSLDRRGVDLYARLARSSGHVAAVLAMMACWDLAPLHAALPRLPGRLLLLAGEGDRAVPLAQQREVAACIPGARLVVVPGAGHLLHEEQPAEVARLILDELDDLERARS